MCNINSIKLFLPILLIHFKFYITGHCLSVKKNCYRWSMAKFDYVPPLCADLVEELWLLTPTWHPDVRLAFRESHAISSCCYAAVLWNPCDWRTWPNYYRVSTYTDKHGHFFFQGYFSAVNLYWLCSFFVCKPCCAWLFAMAIAWPLLVRKNKTIKP